MTNTKEKVKNYFLQVSGDNEIFAEKMTEELCSYVKKEAPKFGSTMLFLFGSDIERIARKTNAKLTNYFQPEDLDVFEIEISVTNGEITKIVYVDAPRKQPASI